jgi:predicted PhzF superfamily epimerase YddE/YHI9
MRAGIIPVEAQRRRMDAVGNCAEAPCACVVASGSCGHARARRRRYLEGPLWVDTGSSSSCFRSRRSTRCIARNRARTQWRCTGSNGQRSMAYVFAREGDRVLARFFFPKHGAIIEDPAPGPRAPISVDGSSRRVPGSRRSSPWTRAKPSAVHAAWDWKSLRTGGSGSPEGSYR